jgi:hypothetical protein
MAEYPESLDCVSACYDCGFCEAERQWELFHDEKMELANIELRAAKLTNKKLKKAVKKLKKQLGNYVGGCSEDVYSK